MNVIRYSTLCCLVTLSLFVSSCTKGKQFESSQKEKALSPESSGAQQSSPFSRENTPSGPCNPNAYNVTLESITLVNGNWEWIWSVQNPNPGNGNNGTVQNLSHWGMEFGSCVVTTSFVSAAYSADGSQWTAFSPSIQADPSQSCMTTSVLKFDYGTTGGSKSYYKLVVNNDYQPVSVPGYYKSGSNTGCCTFTFTGMGCDDGGIIPR